MVIFVILIGLMGICYLILMVAEDGDNEYEKDGFIVDDVDEEEEQDEEEQSYEEERHKKKRKKKR